MVVSSTSRPSHQTSRVLGESLTPLTSRTSSPDGGESSRPAQNSPNPRDQLIGIERFGEIIVGSRSPGPRLGQLFAVRAVRHDDGHVAASAQLP